MILDLKYLKSDKRKRLTDITNMDMTSIDREEAFALEEERKAILSEAKPYKQCNTDELSELIIQLTDMYHSSNNEEVLSTIYAIREYMTENINKVVEEPKKETVVTKKPQSWF